ncbi:MAG: GntR family transcriptional regulator [Clostridiales bacterium]|nr:GntR family transcriptional regulator [Clostridiales bacterium]
MDNQKINISNSEKIPSYVPVYNKIYADIMNDVYNEGDQIPSESALAKECGVSRHTLRQALTILTEDGLIKKQQGKGTIVTKYKKSFNPTEKELFNPMIEYAVNEVKLVEVKYNFAPPTEIASRKLDVDTSEILLASNNIYSDHERIIGHSFMQIPLKRIEHLKIDLTDNEDVSKLLNTTIFNIATQANVNIRLVSAEEHVINFLNISEKETILYLEEVLYDEQGNPLCRCKCYFIPDAYELNLWI